MSISSSASTAISLYDCTCVICMEVFVEPIELPCQHELCRPCFDELRASTLTQFECPQCRYALKEWYAAKQLTSSIGLVNIKRWLLIRQTFPEEVDMRLKGRSAEIVAESIKNYNQYGIVDSVYASVMSDFDLNRILKDDKELQDKPTLSSPPTDTFDIHEFLRKEKEDEEKASMEAIAKLLKEENNLSVNEYVDQYRSESNLDRAFTTTPIKKARKTPQKRAKTPASKTTSRKRATPVIDIQPQSPIRLINCSPNIDATINAVASGQIGDGSHTNSTRISSTNDTIVINTQRGNKRKLIETVTTSTTALASSSYSSLLSTITNDGSHYESKRIKVTSSASYSD